MSAGRSPVGAWPWADGAATGHDLSARRPRGIVAPLLSARTWLAATHLTLELGIGPVVGALVLAALLTAGSLVLALGLGLLLLPLVLVASRRLATAQRRRLALLLDLRLPEPPPLPGRATPRLLRQWSWRELTHHLLGLVRGPVLGGLVVAIGVLALTLLLAPFGLLAAEGAWPVGGAARPVLAGALVVAGVVLALCWPWVVAGAASVAVAEARLLLGPRRSDLQERVEVLTRTRSAAVDAAEAERRRIERDLHDGAQQRLVALAMNLGRARSRFDSDPTAARRLLDDAHGEAMTALSELRDLARGIAPSVLADRGLDAALSALAARSPVPVDVDVEPAATADPTAESVAYFCVAEALTNIAKHAGATRASVTVRRPPSRLLVVVRDDGVGGADLARGTGLTGLRDRVAAVDGSLLVDSPPGGPTVLALELPCAS